MTECFGIDCQAPASGEGDGAYVCEHEHMTNEAQFCRACWLHHVCARFTWHCSACYGKKPEGGRERWGHLCPMQLVQPAVAG